MIIELFGLPGSGKSHLAKKLTEKQKGSKVKLAGKLQILKYYFLCMFSHPFFVLNDLHFCLKYSAQPFYVWNFHVIRFAKWQKAHWQKGLVVIDEGPWQNILSYPKDYLSAKQLQALINQLPTPDLLIFFDISAQKRKHQLGQRTYTSWRQASENDEGWDSCMIKNADQLKKILPGKQNCYFVTDTTAESDVITFIENYEKG